MSFFEWGSGPVTERLCRTLKRWDRKRGPKLGAPTFLAVCAHSSHLLPAPPPSFCHCQGVDDGDVDLPTRFEGKWIRGFVPKFIYMFFYILVYAVRPILIRPKPIRESLMS